MPGQRWIPTVERATLGVLFLWLIWIPLPFASIVPKSRLPLIVTPLVVCAIAAYTRFIATRDRTTSAQPTRPWVIWSNGALLLIAFCLLQLVPLPLEVVDLASPESGYLWRMSSRIITLSGGTARALRPITIDPQATAFEVFRLASLFSAFTTSALLVRSPQRRVALASVLCATGVFEALYGLRQAALQRYDIWGWTNRLIFGRVTGTFVNPNHYAHYLAIILPMTLFIVASKWHVSGSDEVPLSRRVMNLLEHGVIATGYALIAMICCVAGILLAQSRGALLSLGTGLLFVAALLPGKRVMRVSLALAAGLTLVVTLVVYLGKERTVQRFIPNELEKETLVGRRTGISAAVDVWKRFAVFGSGAGTFESVVSMEQKGDLEKIYNHAHNDYAELAATTGLVGFLIALVSFAGGYVQLIRLTFGEEAQSYSWRRRAYQAAALASIAIAAVHSLFDFNFFIPANPATLAAIAGAAVATVDYDKRTRL
jgi:O-antigen ligase